MGGVVGGVRAGACSCRLVGGGGRSRWVWQQARSPLATTIRVHRAALWSGPVEIGRARAQFPAASMLKRATAGLLLPGSPAQPAAAAGCAVCGARVRLSLGPS